MNTDLKAFAAEWLRVAAMTLAPVILAAFLCIPLALERQPGEPAAANASFAWHMT